MFAIKSWYLWLFTEGPLCWLKVKHVWCSSFLDGDGRSLVCGQSLLPVSFSLSTFPFPLVEGGFKPIPRVESELLPKGAGRDWSGMSVCRAAIPLGVRLIQGDVRRVSVMGGWKEGWRWKVHFKGCETFFLTPPLHTHTFCFSLDVIAVYGSDELIRRTRCNQSGHLWAHLWPWFS